MREQEGFFGCFANVFITACLVVNTMAELDKRLLEILACPACHAEVRQEGDRIVCGGCGRRYPIRDGLPIMLIDEAEPPQQAEEEAKAESGES